MVSQNNQGGRRIIAGRRRRPDAAPPGGRERAETPQRWGPSGGGGTGGTPGFGGDSGGGGMSEIPGSGGGGRSMLPLGKGCMSFAGIAVLLIVVVLYFVCSGGNGLNFFPGETTPSDTYDTGGYDTGSYDTYTPQITDQPAAAPFVTNYSSTSGSSVQSPSKPGQTWLVMLYQDADDRTLEKDIDLDLNEAEKAGSSDRVKIVAQMDRFNGGYSGDGNWTGTKRFLLSQDDNLGTLRSQEVADIGEANMASGQTLVDFVTWAMQNYPADKYVLILSDHGMGWPGGWTDPTSQGGDSSIPIQTRIGNLLYLNELDSALSQIRSQTGLDKFEVVGLDACLMGQLEVFTALEPYARYAVASEEVEPSLGFAYTDFLKGLIQNPEMDGVQLSQLIVGSYIEDDQRIVDRSARADFLSQGSPFEGLFGASEDVAPEQLARQVGQSSTLSAVDLSKIGALNQSLNQLVFTFQDADQRAIASSRSYAQSYTSIFGSQVPPSYIDLGNFIQIVKQQAGNTEVSRAADTVLTGIKQAVIAEKHGTKEPGSTGIAIYFPNSQLYENSITGAESYTAIANRFATQSVWDDFLAYHYTGEQFPLGSTQAVMPTRSVIAPAAGGITISPITASSQTVVPGGSVNLQADISGDNIGYIYLFAGYYDQNANSIFVADEDYLESNQTREANGVYYPDWGQGGFTLEFDWEPVVFAIDDGTNKVTALFKPESYGRSFEEAVYTVDGTYTYSDSGQSVPARLYFINGLLRQVFGLTGDSEVSAPNEIIPNPGDTFTVSYTWLDLDENGKVINTVTQQGKMLTFSDKMFTWKTLDAAAGDYMVGFEVEDLDGNRQQSLTRITVE